MVVDTCEFPDWNFLTFCWTWTSIRCKLLDSLTWTSSSCTIFNGRLDPTTRNCGQTSWTSGISMPPRCSSQNKISIYFCCRPSCSDSLLCKKILNSYFIPVRNGKKHVYSYPIEGCSSINRGKEHSFQFNFRTLNKSRILSMDLVFLIFGREKKTQ